MKNSEKDEPTELEVNEGETKPTWNKWDEIERSG